MLDEKGLHPAAAQLQPAGFAATAPQAIAGRIFCVGGAAVDSTFLAERPIVAGTSNPATGSRTFGGVARNIAENLARLGVKTGLLTRVGDDENGRRLKRHLDALAIDTGGVDVVADARTAEYMALLEPDRSLHVGVADMAIFDRLDRALLSAAPTRLDADWIFLDCNCRPDLLKALIERSPAFAGKIAVDAVSVAKAERLPEALQGIDLLFLNLDEAASILRLPRSGLRPHEAVAGLRHRGAGAVVLTLGANGLLVCEMSGDIVAFPAVRAEVADVTGAGDALVAATLAATLAGLPLPIAARWGSVAATLTLERVGSTRADLSFALLRERAEQFPPH